MSLNPLTTDDKCTRHITLAALVGANHFEDRFCANKKVGIGGSEQA